MRLTNSSEVQRWYQVGVVSWGQGCAQEGFAGKFRCLLEAIGPGQRSQTRKIRIQKLCTGNGSCSVDDPLTDLPSFCASSSFVYFFLRLQYLRLLLGMSTVLKECPVQRQNLKRLWNNFVMETMFCVAKKQLPSRPSILRLVFKYSGASKYYRCIQSAFENV